MMNYTLEIFILPTLLIFLFGLVISLHVTKNLTISLFIAITKSLLFFIYFCFFFDGSMTLQDDWFYFKEVSLLHDKGFTFFNVLSDHFFEMILIVGHQSFVYQVFSLLGFDLFGAYYFSVIPLNVILTYFTAFLMYKYLINLNFSIKYAKYYYVFFIIHWDVLAWSTFVNLKDTLVLFLTVLLFYTYAEIENNRRKYFYLILFSITNIILYFLRFYIPAIFIVSILIYKIILYFINISVKRKLQLIIPLLFILFTLITSIVKIYPSAISFIISSFSNPIYGIGKVLLTPLPFKQAENLDFIVFSSLLHWLFIPLLLYGFLTFMKNIKHYNKLVFLFIIYAFIIIVVYGMSNQFHTPRNRFQLVFILSFFQFFGLMLVVKKSKFWKKGQRKCVE